jgi:glycosyltransferase involved in cell wall biosynthesis
MVSNALVTTILPTHNHAPFIAKAIESVLMQKTDFPFDILLHDDASTDGTADICRAYAARFPDKIPLIAQTVNQYQYDKLIQSHILFPKVSAKYTAILDGDDYWLDEDKLQMQVDYLEAHPDCSLCITAAYKVDVSDTIISARDGVPYAEDRVVDVNDMIVGGGEFCASNTIIAPTKLLQSMPAFCDITEVEDVPVQLWCALYGYAWYISKPTAAYRFAVPGSWSNRQYSADLSARMKTHENIRDQLHAFDEHTEGRYHEAFVQAGLFQEYQMLCLQRKIRAIQRAPYRMFFKQETIKRRIRLRLEAYCPRLTARYIAWRRK